MQFAFSDAVLIDLILLGGLLLAGFILLLGKIHYFIAVGGFVTLVTRIEAKESWKRSVLSAMGMDAGFYVLFDLILKAQI